MPKEEQRQLQRRRKRQLQRRRKRRFEGRQERQRRPEQVVVWRQKAEER